MTTDAPKKKWRLSKGKFRCCKRNLREMIKIRTKSYAKPVRNTGNR